jgi:dihydroxyacetone kinase DhaKLM complex PTS-EIIA-like component DhaM
MSKDFDWEQYKTDVIKKYVEKYGSREQAIVEMDAQIGSLKLKADTLSEMVDWEQIEKEIDDEEKASQAQSA